MTPFSARGRWIAAALALASAIVLAIAVTSPALGRWWSIGPVAVGPGGSSACFGGSCEARGLEWLGGDAMFRQAAVAVSTASMVTTVLLIALAAALVSRRKGTLVAGATLTGSLTAAVAGVVFVATFPGTGHLGAAADATIDRGAFLFAAAIVLAIVLAVVVLRRNRA